MAFSRVSQHPPPVLDPTVSQAAFGHRALPKLREELDTDDVTLQLKALQLLAELAHAPASTSSAVDAGVVGSLLRLAAHADPRVRLLALKNVCLLGNAAVGRDALLAAAAADTLCGRFDDTAVEVRAAALQALAQLAAAPGGVTALLGGGRIATLTHKLAIEPALVQEHILETLQLCLRHDTEQALAAGLIPVLVDILHGTKGERAPVLAAAARALHGCCAAAAGKPAALAANAVPVIVAALSHTDGTVRAAAATVVASIAVTTEGKFALLKGGAEKPLAAMLDDKHPPAVLHGVSAMSVLAEAPAARTAFTASLPRLEALSAASAAPFPGRDPEALRRAAAKCAAVITWRP